MRKGLIAATAAVALATATPAAPAKADGWAIAAGIAGGVILTGMIFNNAYGYPNYPYYGPRYGYAYYGGYYGGWGGPAVPWWRPYTLSWRANYDYYGYGYGPGYGYGYGYGYGPGSGYGGYRSPGNGTGYSNHAYGGYPPYALTANASANCYWTKEPGPYGYRAARVCY